MASSFCVIFFVPAKFDLFSLLLWPFLNLREVLELIREENEASIMEAFPAVRKACSLCIPESFPSKPPAKSCDELSPPQVKITTLPLLGNAKYRSIISTKNAFIIIRLSNFTFIFIMPQQYYCLKLYLSRGITGS